VRVAARLGLAAALAALAAAPGARAADPAAATRTPIRHVVFLMQENHSFDNYFGTYPGVNGIPSGTCMPVDPRSHTNRACVTPFSIGDRPATDLSHNVRTFRSEYRGGQMDGFVSTFRREGVHTDLAMGHYVESDLPYYWNVAHDYVLFDRFFTSAAGGSIWNHMFWVTGTPGNFKEDVLPTARDGFGKLPTIFDRLQAKGISWKFYVQNYDPRITYRSDVLGDRGSQVVWVPLLDYARYIDSPELRSHIVDLSQYYVDLRNGTLPAVAYIAPSGSSEHPPGRIQAGERFVRSLITELMRSSSWQSSAFLWSYDDWGGWYDHVRPPKVDAYGYGFRGPALLVSPYARRGFVDDTTLDFTSVLKFIEQNWGLAPLARRDARANSIAGAFDFSRPPRPPQLLAADFRPPRYTPPKSAALYPAYGAAIAVALAALGAAALSSRRSRWSLRRLRRSVS
jgi:phospholipase C